MLGFYRTCNRRLLSFVYIHTCMYNVLIYIFFVFFVFFFCSNQPVYIVMKRFAKLRNLFRRGSLGENDNGKGDPLNEAFATNFSKKSSGSSGESSSASSSIRRIHKYPKFNMDSSKSLPTTAQLIPYHNDNNIPQHNPYALDRSSRLSHPDYTATEQFMPKRPPPSNNNDHFNVRRKGLPGDCNDLYDDLVNLVNKASKHKPLAIGENLSSLPSPDSFIAARFLVCLGMLIAYPMAGTLLFIIFFGLELMLKNDVSFNSKKGTATDLAYKKN